MTGLKVTVRYTIALVCLLACPSLYAQTLKQDMDHTRPIIADGGLYERVSEYAKKNPENADAAVLWVRRAMIEEIGQASENEGVLSNAAFDAQRNLALSLRIEKNLEYAEEEFKSLLELQRISFGETNRNVLITLNDYAMIVDELGKMREAEELYLELLSLTRKAHESDHPDIAVALTNYASLLYGEGRVSEALNLQEEAVRINRATLEPGARASLAALNNLGLFLSDLGQIQHAEEILSEAFDLSRVIMREIPRMADTVTLTIATNYTDVLMELGRFDDAASFLNREVIDAFYVWQEGDLPGDDWNGFPVIPYKSPPGVRAVFLYARALAQSGEAQEALALMNYARRFAGRELGQEHPTTLKIDRLKVEIQLDEIHPSQSYGLTRSLIRRERERAAGLGDGGARGISQRERERSDSRSLELLHTDVSWEVYQQYRQEVSEIPTFSQEQREAELEKLEYEFPMEALEALIEASKDTTSTAVSEVAALRFASQLGLGDLAEERQDLVKNWTALEAAMIREQSKAAPSVSAIDAAQSNLSEIEHRIDAIDTQMAREAPQYHAILSQNLLSSFGVRIDEQPVDGWTGVKDRGDFSGSKRDCVETFSTRPVPWRFVPFPLRVQELRLCLVRTEMAADEAILFLVPTRRGTHAMAVTREDISWFRSDRNEDAISEMVEEFRLGLEVQAGDAFLPAFDLEMAHDLYSDLIAPVEDALEGKSRVYVIADGALSRLPLGTLIASPVATDADGDDPEVLRNADWLADRYALVQLPSLQSLVYIRSFGIEGDLDGDAGFTGFGAPVLEGEARLRGARSATLDAVDAVTLVSDLRGSSGLPLMNTDALRKLAALPGTKSELEQVRSALGASEASLFLAERMTETAIRKADLSTTQILHLATHGFTSEESGATAEPGLVFTPPSEARVEDDGYLAASEVVGLNLTLAEWVILSACNTASPSGKPGETGLSGLAQAFFYAGAESLLVSHWPVFDDIAPLLTVKALKRSQAGEPRAEALQAAMREIRMDPALDAAHPAVWAPFTLVGEGR